MKSIGWGITKKSPENQVWLTDWHTDRMMDRRTECKTAFSERGQKNSDNGKIPSMRVDEIFNMVIQSKFRIRSIDGPNLISWNTTMEGHVKINDGWKNQKIKERKKGMRKKDKFSLVGKTLNIGVILTWWHAPHWQSKPVSSICNTDMMAYILLTEQASLFIL